MPAAKPTFKEFILESINDAGIFKAIFVVGIPGSGKSYTIKQLTGAVAPKIVNTDRTTEFLSKKFNIPSNAETWQSFFRDRTHLLMAKTLYNYINGSLPLFIDGTSNDTSNILNRVGILESIGYDVGMVFITTSLSVAQERAFKRGEEIGRHVSPSFIEQVHATAAQNMEYFKGKFSFFKTVNNDPGELDDAAILKIYRQVSGFYGRSIENPVGIRTLEHLKEQKEKYLVPTIFNEAELKKKITTWYRRLNLT